MTATAARLDLGPTKSCRSRHAVWVPDGPGSGCGVLTVVQQRKQRAPYGLETDVYRVEETPVEVATDYREWLLVNETDATQEQPYRVAAVRGRVLSCSCPCGRVGLPGVECKHQAVFQKLLSGGVL